MSRPTASGAATPSEHAKSSSEHGTSFLEGEYAALGWVLTSPRVNGELRERIHARAMEIHDALAARGVKFGQRHLAQQAIRDGGAIDG